MKKWHFHRALGQTLRSLLVAAGLLLLQPSLIAQNSDTLRVKAEMAGDTLLFMHRFSGIGEEWRFSIVDETPREYYSQLVTTSQPPGNGLSPVTWTGKQSGERGEIHTLSFKVDYSRSFLAEEEIIFLLKPTPENLQPVVIRFVFSARGRLVTYDENRHCFSTDTHILLNEDRPYLQIAWNGFGIGKFFASRIAGSPMEHQLSFIDGEAMKCDDNDVYFLSDQSMHLVAEFGKGARSQSSSTFVLKGDFHTSDSLVITVRRR